MLLIAHARPRVFRHKRPKAGDCIIRASADLSQNNYLTLRPAEIENDPVKALSVFIICFTIPAATAFAGDKTDSLLTLLKKNPPLKEQITLYKLLYGEAYTNGDSLHIVRYLSEGISLAEKTDDKASLFELKSKLGKFLQTKSALKPALDFLTEADKLKAFANDSSLLAENYGSLGLVHYFMGDYEEAANDHLEAVKIYEKLNKPGGIARAYNNLGIVFQKMKEWDKALDYHQRSLAICEKENIEEGVAHNLGNIGIIYREKQEYDKAIDAYTRSLVIHKKTGSKLHVSTNLGNLGSLYEHKNELKKAGEFYRQSLSIQEEIGYKNGIVTNLINLGILSTKLQQYKEAEQYLQKALTMSLREEMKQNQMEAYKALAELFEQKKDFKTSLDYRLKYEERKDSLINENNLKQIKELELNYETEKTEKDLLRLSQENLIGKATLDKKNSLIKMLLAGIVAAIIIFILIFMISKQRSKNRQQFAMIEAIGETQEKERTRIASDLHDSVGSMLSTVKRQFMEFKHVMAGGDDHYEKNYEQSLNLLDNACDEVRRIAHDMMPGVLLKFGLEAAINTLVSQLNQPNVLAATAYTFNLQERLDPKIEVLVYRVLQELTQNVVRHAHARTLEIHITRHEHNLNIIVEDDGTGFDGTNMKQDGIGLKNIRSRVQHVKGNFTIDTHKDEGSRFIIDIPV